MNVVRSQGFQDESKTMRGKFWVSTKENGIIFLRKISHEG